MGQMGVDVSASDTSLFGMHMVPKVHKYSPCKISWWSAWVADPKVFSSPWGTEHPEIPCKPPSQAVLPVDWFPSVFSVVFWAHGAGGGC